MKRKGGAHRAECSEAKSHRHLEGRRRASWGEVELQVDFEGWVKFSLCRNR